MGTVDYDMRDPNHTEGSFSKAWIPYEHDLTQYPEVFHKYQENYRLMDDLKQRFENEPKF